MQLHFENVCLETIAYTLPEEVITSEEIERRLAPVYERLRLPEGRLELMSGIRERRLFKPGIRPGQKKYPFRRKGNRTIRHRSTKDRGSDPRLRLSRLPRTGYRRRRSSRLEAA